MRHGQLNRQQAIEAVGLAAVEAVEKLGCEPTGRCQTDGDTHVEFAASAVAPLDEHGFKRKIVAYYYQPVEAVTIPDGVDDLSLLDWEVAGYDVI